MNTIAELLYHHACETPFSIWLGEDYGTYRDIVRRADGRRTELKGMLSQQQWAAMTAYYEGRMAVESMEQQGMFYAGLSMGIALGAMGAV